MSVSTLKVFGIIAYSTKRISKQERSNRLYYYDVRHSDSDLVQPATIERFVGFNYLATIVTEEPIELENGYHSLSESERSEILHILSK